MSVESLGQFLAKVDLFSGFDEVALARIAREAQLRTYEFGDRICAAGEFGEGLYVVKSGRVRLFTPQGDKEISIGIRKEGETFGEVAALRKYTLEHSARASGRTEVLFVSRNTLTSTLEHNKEAAAFVAKYVATNEVRDLLTKRFDLRSNKLEPRELQEIARSVGIKPIRKGQVVLKQASREDRHLYVIRSGSVEVVHEDGEQKHSMGMLHSGGIFGERSCLFHQENVASVIAATDVVLMVIPEAAAKRIAEHNPAVREGLEKRDQFAEREIHRRKQVAKRGKGLPRLALHPKSARGERLIKRFRLVEQQESMDCGAACLAMVCKHYGIDISLGRARELVNVTIEGASHASLAAAGDGLGFNSRAVRCSYPAMLGFPLPLIAHWENYHYVVAYGLSKDHVWVADPAVGLKKMTVAEFERGWAGTCLLYDFSSQRAQVNAARSPWIRFINYLNPHRRTITYLFIATMVIQLLGLAPPIIVQNVLDRVFVQGSVELLNLLMLGFVLVNVFQSLSTLMRAFLINFIMRNVDFSMTAQFCKHTFSLPMGFLSRRRTGELFARFQENEKVRQFLTEATVNTVLNVLMIFLYFSALVAYSLKMSLLLMVLLIPLASIPLLITGKIRDYARRTFEASTDAESLLMESIAGAETIKGMGNERLMRMKWEKRYAQSLEVRYAAGRFAALAGFASTIASGVATITVLWVGARMVLVQELTVGQLMAINMLMGSIMSPFLALVALWDRLQQTRVAMERLGDILDVQPEQKPDDLPSRIVLPDVEGNIGLENVYFRYRGSETPYVLENINLQLEAGTLVAIVGQSGSGKTTLAKLLVGFYPPTEGKLTVDGYDLRFIDKESYRRRIGYVMQTNLVFSGTVAQNIALGDESPDRRRLVEAARLADAHGFISRMPMGYEQTLGERGVGLSGGQLQRLCIARALYHDPRLLILDEATSALDTQSEATIMQNMQQILAGRTAVVIAHRLSTVMQADKILVLYKGCLVEEGRHDDLVGKRGMYYQLVQKQLAGAQ